MNVEMFPEQLCDKLNRLLETYYLHEVLETLGDRCNRVGRDGRNVTNPANWYVVDGHAVVYLRVFDEFVPLRQMGGVPESVWHAYQRLGVRI